jgi:hypothetical protein
MMEIKVKIDCGEKTCDKCKLLGFDIETYTPYGFCTGFSKELKTAGNNYLRLPECIAAEVKNA